MKYRTTSDTLCWYMRSRSGGGMGYWQLVILHSAPSLKYAKSASVPIRLREEGETKEIRKLLQLKLQWRFLSQFLPEKRIQILLPVSKQCILFPNYSHSGRVQVLQSQTLWRSHHFSPKHRGSLSWKVRVRVLSLLSLCIWQKSSPDLWPGLATRQVSANNPRCTLYFKSASAELHGLAN